VNQSSTIAAFLLIGFVVYIVMKGELQQYWSVLFGPSQTKMASNATAGGTGTSGQTGTPELFPITP
jgi:hypothetical protein